MAQRADSGLPGKAQITRRLRIVCVVCFVIGLPILLPYGICFQQALPTVGIAPLTVSAVLAMSQLVTFGRRSRQRRGDYEILVGDDGRDRKGDDPLGFKLFIAFCDIVLAIATLVINIVTISILGDFHTCWRRWCDAKIPMIGTYGTVPIWFAFFAHTACLLLAVPWSKLPVTFQPACCPHCHARLLQECPTKPLATGHDSVIEA